MEMASVIKPRQSDLDHLSWLQAYPSDLRGAAIVDLGCGSGYLCQYALEQGAQKALGVDVVAPPDWRESQPWSFRQLDLEAASWPESVREVLAGRAADMIFAFDILEHLENPWQFVRQCHGLLAATGRLVLTTPNVNSWERVVRPHSWSGCRDPQHKTLWTPYSLEFFLKKCGFKVEILTAPIRRMGRASRWFPKVGGQLFSLSSRKYL